MKHISIFIDKEVSFNDVNGTFIGLLIDYQNMID